MNKDISMPPSFPKSIYDSLRDVKRLSLYDDDSGNKKKEKEKKKEEQDALVRSTVIGRTPIILSNTSSKDWYLHENNVDLWQLCVHWTVLQGVIGVTTFVVDESEKDGELIDKDDDSKERGRYGLHYPYVTTYDERDVDGMLGSSSGKRYGDELIEISGHESLNIGALVRGKRLEGDGQGEEEEEEEDVDKLHPLQPWHRPHIHLTMLFAAYLLHLPEARLGLIHSGEYLLMEKVLDKMLEEKKKQGEGGREMEEDERAVRLNGWHDFLIVEAESASLGLAANTTPPVWWLMHPGTVCSIVICDVTFNNPNPNPDPNGRL
jgi:hypothetical protein